MKKFVIKILIYVLAFCIIAILPCVLLDPYNVFHPFHVRDNGVEPNKNFIKMTYIKANPDKFDSFMFGSSLTGMVNPENVPEASCYNMTHSGGIPSETLANLKTMLKSGIVPKKIFLGLESISYSDCYENRCSNRMRCPYEYSRTNPLKFLELYIDPAVNIEALKTVMASETENNSVVEDVFYNNGGYPFYGYTWKFDENEARRTLEETKSQMRTAISSGTLSSDRPQYMDEALESVKEIVKLCKENNIELTVFTNPMYYETFSDAVIKQCYLMFLSELAEITPYYNFCGFNDYTTDLHYYHEDKTHFLVELGDIMLDVMCNDAENEKIPTQGFGTYVTKNNVGELIKLFSSPDTYA